MMKYLIIDLQKGSKAQFSFDGLNYSLDQEQVASLIDEGILHASETVTLYTPSQYDLSDLMSLRPLYADSGGFKSPSRSLYGYGCHQCRKFFQRPYDNTCPHCYSIRWHTYTLFYCCECHALFESYWHPLAGITPYDRFPTCPACKSEQWCPAENERMKSHPPKEEMQAQAETKRQQEVDAYARIMEFRKQQELKKLGLRQPSSQREEKGAAIPEAEVYYKSADRKTPWLDKGARPVQLPDTLPRHSTPASQQPISTPQQPMLQQPAPASQQPTAAPRRGILSVLRNWFRSRRP